MRTIKKTFYFCFLLFFCQFGYSQIGRNVDCPVLLKILNNESIASHFGLHKLKTNIIIIDTFCFFCCKKTEYSNIEVAVTNTWPHEISFGDQSFKNLAIDDERLIVLQNVTKNNNRKFELRFWQPFDNSVISFFLIRNRIKRLSISVY